VDTSCVHRWLDHLDFVSPNADWSPAMTNHKSYLDHEIEEIRQRCDRVETVFCGNFEHNVIIIEPDLLECYELKSLLFAMGVNVYCADLDSQKLEDAVIVVKSSSRRRPEIVRELDSLKARYPGSSICFISGRFSTQSGSYCFCDARSVLQLAGIGFVSEITMDGIH